jgi:aryl-alcohol dehydrogenase-like predicted oxidoreductase
MRYTMLGGADLKVSRLCLGAMTFGKQTDEAEAQRILDMAAAGGTNFIDTADGLPYGHAGPLAHATERGYHRALAQGQA